MESKRLTRQMKRVKNSLREGRADSRELKKRLGSKYERRALYFLLLRREVVRLRGMETTSPMRYWRMSFPAWIWGV